MADSSGMDGLGPMLMSMATKGGGGGDGMFGGSGSGLIGGLILGSLLRQGNGGLFGNNGDGASVVGGAVLRNPPEQNQANMDLMASIGQVDKAVAVSTAAMEASQAMQSANITVPLCRPTVLHVCLRGSYILLIACQISFRLFVSQTKTLPKVKKTR